MPVPREALLALYDVPDPERPGRLIPGYDKEHAARTTDIVLLVARELGVAERYIARLEIATLLHDIGRAGMDPELFGRIFQSAQEAGLPVRLPELRRSYRDLTEKNASERFVELVRPVLRAKGIAVTPKVREHIDMRMAFKQRVRRILRDVQPELTSLGVTIEPWMEKLMLYYYYPQELEGQPAEVRLMAETLVACENFEAYNNVQRGRDYYGRTKEQLRDVFSVLNGFVERGLVSRRVYDTLARLTAAGRLDDAMRMSRGLPPDAPLSAEDEAFKRELMKGARG